MQQVHSITSRGLIRWGIGLWILFSISLALLSYSTTLIAERTSYGQQYTAMPCSATSIMMVSTVPCLTMDPPSTITVLPPSDDDPITTTTTTTSLYFQQQKQPYDEQTRDAGATMTAPVPANIHKVCWLFHWQVQTGMPLNTPLVYIAAWQPGNVSTVQNNITFVDQYARQWMRDHTNVTCWVQFSSPMLPMIVFDPPYESSRATIGTTVMSLFGIVTAVVILLVFLYSKYVYSPSYLSL